MRPVLRWEQAQSADIKKEAAIPIPSCALRIYFFGLRVERIEGSDLRGRVKGIWIGLVQSVLHCFGPVIHVAHGYDGAVINPSPSGDLIYAESEFCSHAPGLKAVIDFPCPRVPVLEPSASPVTITRAIVRRLSLGFVRGNDCVYRACQCLRRSGVYVPRGIVTPTDLWEFASEHGTRQALYLD